jgi:undecaprenyl diphosphate synthase
MKALEIVPEVKIKEPENFCSQDKIKNGLSPIHVAIIMDGNGRWAKMRGLPRTAGHKKGAESVKEAIQGAIEHGVTYLTLFGFSNENWKRPHDEIQDLMGLLRFYLKNEVRSLHKHGVKLSIVGDRSKLSKDVVDLIENAEKKTSKNVKLTLVLALSYGSRQEILLAVKKIAQRIAKGDIDPDELDERVFETELFTHHIPDPDLLIRTSGEKRMSNFLLWQSAYTELIFLDVLWPDFTRQDFSRALEVFASRERRFGSVSS